MAEKVNELTVDLFQPSLYTFKIRHGRWCLGGWQRAAGPPTTCGEMAGCVHDKDIKVTNAAPTAVPASQRVESWNVKLSTPAFAR